MQLKRKSVAANPRRAGLAAATLGLLGASSPTAHAGFFADLLDAKTPWEFDTALLVYSESDGRVQAAEPVFKVTKDLGGERLLSTKLVVDVLTGASPNGATPASQPQTFSGPSSGDHRYTTAAFDTPLDDSFKDTRVALSFDYLFPVGEDGKLGWGVMASNEYDFVSAGANVRYTHDLNQANTTLSAGVNVELDQIDAVGGIPRPLSVVPPPDNEGAKEIVDSSDSKTVTDLVLGITQVLDPVSVAQFNYSLSLVSGYQTDPYKILSVVGDDGEPVYYIYEERPDTRTKHALFGRYKRFMFGQDIADASYRFMTDDWGVVSHTLDFNYRWNFSDHQFVEPHLRWYSQGAADFYHVAAHEDGVPTGFASADPRLGEFDAFTIGAKYGHTLKSGNQWSARLELYQQVGKEAGVPADAAAGLAKFNLEPDLTAVMLTVGYRFKW